MGFRRSFTVILGIILVTYGVILNFLGGLVSFMHPGPYHQGAMGTSMWSGLAFILLGAINIVKAMERKREKRGISLLLPVTNILVVLVSCVCISLTSWAMSAPGIALLTKHRVTELILPVVASSTNSSDSTGASAETDGNFQVSLLPLYSTVIVASGVILLMALLAVCFECVLIVAMPPLASREKERPPHDVTQWEERNGLPQHFTAAEDSGKQLAYNAGDAVGEVTYGSTPAFVNTGDRQSFRHNTDLVALPPYNGHVQRIQGQQQLEQRHQRGDKPRDRSYLYRVPEEPREVDRPVRRPNPYFYL